MLLETNIKEGDTIETMISAVALKNMANHKANSDISRNDFTGTPPFHLFSSNSPSA